ncbi:hypothetical protein [Ralstonia solanacearum]|uniref:hypothetical protein n=1 Tax=Ralstonia solanacearum TaxID=305 RepID=UPI0001D9543B|nr:hypothetical protein [Ralstonia solanacearum]CBJ42536.1 protein of unknown function [Ralstonia solanacearum CFBP2957]
MSGLVPSGTLINALLDLQDAVCNYREHGHGDFVWKAYAAMRTADRHVAEHPELVPTIDMYREEVLAAVEEIAQGMLALADRPAGEREVTSDAGRKQLLYALKWADRGAASTQAREKEREVVERLRIVFSMLANYSDEKLRGLSDPAWADLKSLDGAYSMVAKDIEESPSSVRKIWKAATASGIGLMYARDAAAAIEKRRSEISNRDKKTVRPRADKANDPHPWKR